MQEVAGRVIRLAAEKAAVPGCTVSKQLYRGGGYGIAVFSLASGTEISAESYGYPKLWLVHGGRAAYMAADTVRHLHAGDGILTPLGVPVGVTTDEGCVYTEIELRKDTTMNNILKAGEIITLKDLLP